MSVGTLGFRYDSRGFPDTLLLEVMAHMRAALRRP